MDRSGNKGAPIFGIRISPRQKNMLRQLYRRSMAAAGTAAVLLTFGVQAVGIGVQGIRRFAEKVVFSGITVAGSDTPGGIQWGSSGIPGDLSLFLSPNTGDPPAGGLWSEEDEDSSAPSDGTSEKPPAGDSDEPPDSQTVPTPAGGAVIALRDLSPKAPLSLVNMTSTLDPDLEKVYRDYLAASGTETLPKGDAPLVLILHTHSTEAYAPEGSDCLPEGSVPRSIDPEENVVAVGTAFAETLESRGIPTLHCTFGHDLEDYAGAYDREKATILSYLETYPSIRYIFDVHRDSIEGSDGSIVKTAATVDGKPAAQLMFVVGTNEKGANHPRWEDNLGYALALQTALSAEYPGLMRAVNLRGASFNEQYTPCSLLVEVGASGNTLAEAKRTAVLLGNAVADEILG